MTHHKGDQIQEGVDIQSDRRSYFRIGDAVALTVRAFPEDGLEDIKAQLERDRLQFGLHNQLNLERDKTRPTLRKIQAKYPEVGDFLQMLENRFSLLADAVCQDESLPKAPTHKVSLSGSGLLFGHDKPLQENEWVKFVLTLFPDRVRIHGLGKIVATGRDVEDEPSGDYPSAMEFVELLEIDREIIVKHVQHLQFEALRSRQNEDDD